jgi:hypothetical protein
MTDENHHVQGDNGRLSRERKTIAEMIRIYCKGQHGTASGLCEQCQELLDYAMRRLQRCVFGARKPTCANCPVHCYKPQMRERIRQVMRYAGPRMLLRHPILAIRHKLDDRRPPVEAGALPGRRKPVDQRPRPAGRQ